jgi:hypothetical protein
MGSLTGALYFLHSSLNFSNGSSVKDAYTIVVADTLSFNLSDWSVSNDYSSLSNGSPIKQPKMVEWSGHATGAPTITIDVGPRKHSALHTLEYRKEWSAWTAVVGHEEATRIGP